MYVDVLRRNETAATTFLHSRVVIAVYVKLRYTISLLSSFNVMLALHNYTPTRRYLRNLEQINKKL